MKIIIGLVGEKGSGKETFGNLLQEILSEKKIVRIRDIIHLGFSYLYGSRIW